MLKLTKYTNTSGTFEAEWFTQEVIPATGAEGEEGHQPESTKETTVRVIAYSGDQIDLFRADVAQYGGEIDEALLAEIEAEWVPPPPPLLAEIKATKWEEIKAERERRTLTGGYQADGKWFHSDLISRGQQLGLNILNGSIPAGIMWKTMDGSFIEMTWALAQQILAAASQSDRAIFLAAEAHKVAMEASADPANYDFSGGWPPMYGES